MKLLSDDPYLIKVILKPFKEETDMVPIHSGMRNSQCHWHLISCGALFISSAINDREQGRDPSCSLAGIGFKRCPRRAAETEKVVRLTRPAFNPFSVPERMDHPVVLTTKRNGVLKVVHPKITKSMIIGMKHSKNRIRNFPDSG